MIDYLSKFPYNIGLLHEIMGFSFSLFGSYLGSSHPKMEVLNDCSKTKLSNFLS